MKLKNVSNEVLLLRIGRRLVRLDPGQERIFLMKILRNQQVL